MESKKIDKYLLKKVLFTLKPSKTSPILVMPEEPDKQSNFYSPIELFWKKAEEFIPSWGLVGLVGFIALHFAKEKQWKEAIIALVITGILATLAAFFNKLQPKLDKLFGWLADKLENSVLQTWWLLTANFQGRYYKQLIYNCRDYRTKGLKTKGPFALNLEKVFVPLKVAPESLNKISAAMLQDKDLSSGLSIWDFLAAAKQPAYKRMAMIGPPGSGKTTLLEHLTLVYAQNAQRRHHLKAPALIPILLYLHDVKDVISEDNSPDLARLVEDQELIKPLNPNQWFERKLEQGLCLVMLDGLDEIADETKRQKVGQWLDKQMGKYSENTFILTSRPFGYHSTPLERIGTILEVQAFNLQQVQQFIHNWYLQNEIMRHRREDLGVQQEAKKQAKDLINRIKNTPALATIALNPLLLTMIATVHCFRGALPGRRIELYAEICDVLLGRRQDAKGSPDQLAAIQKKAVLQVLALGLMQKKTLEIPLALGDSLIRKKLRSVLGHEADPAKFLKQIENVSGLLVERENNVYEFAHKSFQEYLAAVQIKDLAGKEKLLIDKIDNDWWHETIRLYAAQSDVTNIVNAALDRSTPDSLALAYDCLEEGLSILPETRQYLEDGLEDALEASDSRIRRLAAQVKLARRLNKLIRLDQGIEIDTSYITCAEYQLFVDEKLMIKEHHQPLHWKNYKFPEGEAKQPVTGVLPKSAEAFCNWLTTRHPKLGYFYRLPKESELQDLPVTEKRVGSWCYKGNLIGMGDISNEVWEKIQNNFNDLFERDYNSIRNLTPKNYKFWDSFETNFDLRSLYTLSTCRISVQKSDNSTSLKQISAEEKTYSAPKIASNAPQTASKPYIEVLLPEIDNKQTSIEAVLNGDISALLKQVTELSEIGIKEINSYQRISLIFAWFKVQLKFMIAIAIGFLLSALIGSYLGEQLSLYLVDVSKSAPDFSFISEARDAFRVLAFIIRPILFFMVILLLHRLYVFTKELRKLRPTFINLSSFLTEIHDFSRFYSGQTLLAHDSALLAFTLYQSIGHAYGEMSRVGKALNNKKTHSYTKIADGCTEISKVYAAAYLNLTSANEREAGRMTAWEGVRIVREGQHPKDT